MYYVNIKDNETGEVRRTKHSSDWHVDSEHYWTVGNFGCDCNRKISFVGLDNYDWSGDSGKDCGDSRYSVVNVELEDGTTFTINESER